MAGHRNRSTMKLSEKKSNDSGTLCLTQQYPPGTTGVSPKTGAKKRHLAKTGFSYSISGNPGALGGMFLSDAQTRLPGTWYDRTDAVNALRTKEVKLGLSEFADTDFRRLAKRTQANLKAEASVDADIHFNEKELVENIQVRGSRGTRLYSFDFKAAQSVEVPKSGDAFKPLNDAITALIALVLEVR